MGAHLATQALSVAYWHAVEHNPLSTRERWVLVVMALRARDRDGATLPARIYASGWQRLGHEALGRPIWNDAAKRDVARAISGLKKRGLIRDATEQDNRHHRYEVLPEGVTHTPTRGVTPVPTDG